MNWDAPRIIAIRIARELATDPSHVALIADIITKHLIEDLNSLMNDHWEFAHFSRKMLKVIQGSPNVNMDIGELTLQDLKTLEFILQRTP